VLTGSPSVTHNLNLTSGSIDLSTFNLTMADPVGGPLTSITGADASHYLHTPGGVGRLIFTRTGNNATARLVSFFPVGDGSYTPSTLSLSANSAYVGPASASVNNVAPTPSSDPVGDNVVQKTWDVSWGTTAAPSSLPAGEEGAVTLQWNTSDEAIDFQRFLCRVAHYDGSIWTHYLRDFAAPTAVATGVWSRTRLHLTTFSPFAVEDFDQPLPVELTRFSAVRQGSDALLTWATASERNSRGFRVEVSSGSGLSGRAAWRTLGFVSSATPTSASVREYSFVDVEKGKQGLRAYRLVPVDVDGTEQVATSARTVRFDGGVQTQVTALPNPFTTRLMVLVDAASAGEADLTLVDAVGRVVLQLSASVVSGSNELAPELPVSLPVGVYTLRTVVDGQTFHQRIQKQ
jgi:hypothetical protein